MNENSTPLFPELTPFQTEMLPVGDGHTLYVEQSGNPAGIPVVVLHGGPGSGSKPKNRQFFNPDTYHIILFDQRGCGRSMPLGNIHANTTAHLVADIETIRTHLGLEKWVVYGNSWGSALALAYAQAHPAPVLGMVIGAIFTASERELDWFYNPDGVARFFPAEYAALRQLLGNPAPAAIPGAIHQAVMRDDPHAWAVGRAASLLDALTMDLVPNRGEILAWLDGPEFNLAAIRVWSHYFANACFLTPEQLLAGAPRLAHLPIHILQAGLDLCCPPETAIRLHQVLPQSGFTLVPLCGHRATEAMEAARIEATTALAHRLKA